MLARLVIGNSASTSSAFPKMGSPLGAGIGSAIWRSGVLHDVSPDNGVIEPQVEKDSTIVSSSFLVDAL